MVSMEALELSKLVTIYLALPSLSFGLRLLRRCVCGGLGLTGRILHVSVPFLFLLLRTGIMEGIV